MFNLSQPDITQKEIDIVIDVMKSNILSIGPKINKFEQKFKDYFNIKHAIAVNSGTSGLHLLVKALGITEGDEVITTPFSFVASTNCFLFEKAKPVFIDIDKKTMNMDISRIEEKITNKTKAILVVDVFGHPINMIEVKKIADKYNLKIIEDSCEAIGSEYKGIKAGTLGDCGVFAFYPNKQITTGEGGMIITNNDEIADLCRSLRSQGRSNTGLWLHHDVIGYNYRMSELHAALGIVQMDRLDEILEKRKNVANFYNERLKDIDKVTIPYIHSDVTRMSYFVYVIRLDMDINRDRVLEYLLSNGIGCKPYFTPIHLQSYMKKMFGFKETDFPITEKISNSTIALPFHNNLTINEIDYVVGKLEEAISKKD